MCEKLWTLPNSGHYLSTLLGMHESAFCEWGEVPDEILYDRMKTVWTGLTKRGEIVWNAIFLGFAGFHAAALPALYASRMVYPPDRGTIASDSSDRSFGLRAPLS